MMFTFSEFFAGTGLVSHVFKSEGGQCLFANDLDERKARIYTANHGSDHFLLEDITKLKGLTLKLDGSWGSFPCTDASVAKALGSGKKGEGLKGKSTSLFWHWLRVAHDEAVYKPKWLIGENVTALLHHKEDVADIVSALRQRGYAVGIVKLELADLRPMRRSRIFILATRVGFPKQWRLKPQKLYGPLQNVDLDFWPRISLPPYQPVAINYKKRIWRKPTERQFKKFVCRTALGKDFGFYGRIDHRVSDIAYCMTKGEDAWILRFLPKKPFGWACTHPALHKRILRGRVYPWEARRLFGVDESYVIPDADVSYGLGDAVAPDHARLLAQQFIRPIMNPFFRHKHLAGWRNV